MNGHTDRHRTTQNDTSDGHRTTRHNTSGGHRKTQKNTGSLLLFFRVSLWRSLPLVLLAVVALLFRLIGLRYGLPAVYNPDEVAIMSRALAFAKGDLNPHNFLYPSFYFYVLFAWEALTAVAAVATRAVSSFGGFQREFFLDPTRVFVAGRLLTALLGSATVIATGVLTTRIAGRFAGIAAAALLAVAPLHVLNSHYVKHDVPVTLAIVLAYLAYERLWSRPGEAGLPPEGGSYGAAEGTGSRESARYGARSFRLQAEAPVIAAAAITGVAFSTHYYTIFLAIPLAWSAARHAPHARGAVKNVALAAIVSALVFFLLSPFLLVEPATALRDIAANRQIVVDRAAADVGYAASAMRYLRVIALDAIGVPAALLAAAGLVVAARRDWARTLWLLAFPVPFLSFIFSTYPASRYIVPVTPFLVIFAALAIDAARRTPRAPGALAAAMLGVATTWAAFDSVTADRFIRQTDTRTLALEYMTAHVPPGATVLTQPYSVPLEPTADALREAVQRSGREMPTKTRLQIERRPYPAPAYRVLYLGRGLDADKVYVPYEQLAGSDPLRAARAAGVAFVVLKRYNERDPATLPFLTALAREGRKIAEFSPYRQADTAEDGGRRPDPFLHNTDAPIHRSLERPGPMVEIWRLDGGS